MYSIKTHKHTHIQNVQTHRMQHQERKSILNKIIFKNCFLEEDFSL